MPMSRSTISRTIGIAPISTAPSIALPTSVTGVGYRAMSRIDAAAAVVAIGSQSSSSLGTPMSPAPAATNPTMASHQSSVTNQVGPTGVAQIPAAAWANPWSTRRLPSSRRIVISRLSAVSITSSNECEDCLALAVAEAKRDVLVVTIGKNVKRIDARDAAREVGLARAELAEHDLDVLIHGVEGHAEQRLLSLLHLRAELGIVHLETRATTTIPSREVVEHLGPARRLERQRRARSSAASIVVLSVRRDHEYGTRRHAEELRRHAANYETRDEAVTVAPGRDQIAAAPSRIREQLPCGIPVQDDVVDPNVRRDREPSTETGKGVTHEAHILFLRNPGVEERVARHNMHQLEHAVSGEKQLRGSCRAHASLTEVDRHDRVTRHAEIAVGNGEHRDVARGCDLERGLVTEDPIDELVATHTDDDQLCVALRGDVADDACRLAIQHFTLFDERAVIASARTLLAHAASEIGTQARCHIRVEEQLAIRRCHSDRLMDGDDVDRAVERACQPSCHRERTS